MKRITIIQYEQAADEKVSIGGIKWLKKWDVCVQCDSREEAEALKGRLAEPEKEQEPVAQVQVAEDYYAHVVLLPNVDPINLDQQFLYTAPSQREWQGLTDADFAGLTIQQIFAAKFAEAKLKEKNT